MEATPAHTSPPHHRPCHHRPAPYAPESADPPPPRAPAASLPETNDESYVGSPQPTPPNPPDSQHQLNTLTHTQIHSTRNSS
jgi:hypothetical protein